MTARQEFELIRQFLRAQIEAWIREGRQAQELAQRANLSAGQISHMRAGRPIGFESILGLAHAFGWSLTELLERSKRFAAERRTRSNNHKITTAIALPQPATAEVTPNQMLEALSALPSQMEKLNTFLANFGAPERSGLQETATDDSPLERARRPRRTRDASDTTTSAHKVGASKRGK